MEERFWDKVDRGDEGECWEWKGAMAGDGYGQFTIEGRNVRAHRVAAALEIGYPGESHVLHHCDNKSCVNPEHLYLGSHSDNMQDAMERGLMASGERNSSSKLTQDEVAEIKRRLNETALTNTAIAEDYDVQQQTISRIKHGILWSHVDPE